MFQYLQPIYHQLQKIKLKKLSILVVIFFFLLLLVIFLFRPVNQYLPSLISSPISIMYSNKIYDQSAKQRCEVIPYSQNFIGEQLLYQVNLYPSYKNSVYQLELGALPLGVEGNIKPISGRGNMSINFSLNNITKESEGSFTIPLVYHEYQISKFKWLTNYCLFNVILPVKEYKI